MPLDDDRHGALSLVRRRARGSRRGLAGSGPRSAGLAGAGALGVAALRFSKRR